MGAFFFRSGLFCPLVYFSIFLFYFILFILRLPERFISFVIRFIFDYVADG